MKKFITTMVLMIAVAVIAVAKNPTATAVFTVSPAMTCQNCENKIKTNIRFEKGVTDITTDLQAQTVTVTYNPEKTDVAKLIEGFKKIGYTATQVNAQPTASTTAPACGSCPGCRH